MIKNSHLILLFCLLLLVIISCSRFSLFRKPEPEVIIPIKDSSLLSAIIPLPKFDENARKKKKYEKKRRKYKEHLKSLFQSETSPTAAYQKLKAELKNAGTSERLYALFARFVEAPAFLRHRRNGREYTDFLEIWVDDAVVHQNDEIRLLYSNFYYRIRPPGLTLPFFV